MGCKNTTPNTCYIKLPNSQQLNDCSPLQFFYNLTENSPHSATLHSTNPLPQIIKNSTTAKKNRC